MLLGGGVAVLAACGTVGPDYHLPADAAINQPGANKPFIDIDGSTALDPAGTLPPKWWRLYNDPLLDTLVEDALKANAGLRAASANLRRTYAVYDQALDAGGFDTGLQAGVQHAQLSAESYLQENKLPVYNLGSGALNASYEFDLFGKLKRGAEAARDDADAGEAAVDLARITVAAEVARSYMESCHASHEIDITERSLSIQLHGAQIAQRLFDAGRGTSTAVLRSKAQGDLIRASLPGLHARKTTAGYALAALLGKTPGDIPAGVATCSQAPTLARPIPVGDGMALLRRRPDIREAERKLAGATARIGVAIGAMYPNVEIGASVGASGLLADIGTATTRSWSIGPLITWTYPSSGAHARVRGAEAGAEAALAQWDQTVLNALRDTQAALDTYARRLERQQALAMALAEARQAAADERTLYQGGRAPYLTSLDADRTLASAEAQAAETDAQVSLDQINLFLALGGGWK
jgi:NodT family efflux transporter outer membrane factor (OMF) lipoprotein